jgi:hypothetical protein
MSASGDLPYFTDLSEAVMSFFPERLTLGGMELQGLEPDQQRMNHKIYPFEGYHELACQSLEYTRRYSTTKKVAKYVLKP